MSAQKKKTLALITIIVFLITGCGKDLPVATPLPSTPTATMAPSPTVTLTPTLPPVTPEVTETSESSSVQFVVIPEQITLQDEMFIPLDVYEFLLLQSSPAESMTWRAVGSEHIAVTISNGVVTANPLDPVWFGSETIQVEGCEPTGACATQDIVYSVLDKAAFSDVRVTFVGNAGFLITVGDKKVLIDAIFEGFPPGYALPSAVQSFLLNAEPPFDDVDLILVTHNHSDHFSATMVRQHMQNNLNAVFISTTQAASQLADLGDRVIAVDPVTGTPVNVEANGIQVEAIYLSHGTPPAGQEEDFNNAYLVTIDGIRIFHTGDIDSLQSARPYNLAAQNIDIAFIPSFYMRTGSSRSALNNDISANYNIPMHYQYTLPEFNDERIRFVYPEAILFSMELESWFMPLPDD